ncbi:MAG: hypothetical protein AAFV54_07960 [Pseudomonadota bacterium]
MWKKLGSAVLVAGVISVTAASADEVWQIVGESQTAVYEQDLEGTDIAVLKYGNVRMYIDGLAGVYSGRDKFYSGVWLADDDALYDNFHGAKCLTAMKRPGSDETREVWGRVTLTFIKPDFPSAITIRTGSCFDEGDYSIVAEPVVAEE